MPRRSLAIAACLVLAGVIAALALGLGGDDDGGGEGGDARAGAERAVRDFLERTSERDASLCDDLLTEAFLRQQTGRQGKAARSFCKEQLKAAGELKLKLLDVRRARIDGDRARVTFRYEVNGQPAERTLSLVRQDGEFKVDGSPR